MTKDDVELAKLRVEACLADCEKTQRDLIQWLEDWRARKEGRLPQKRESAA